MSKAFTREQGDAGDEEPDPSPRETVLPPGTKNYITPAGWLRLKSELKHLVESERPEVVRTVSWAASNGDRSENGDYIYGKRRLREIDWRIRFLMKRLDIAEVVDPRDVDHDRVFFGATVVYSVGDAQRTISIVGLDEVDPARGRISWVSPVAKALLRAGAGDVVTLRTPVGNEQMRVLEIRYERLD